MVEEKWNDFLQPILINNVFLETTWSSMPWFHVSASVYNVCVCVSIYLENVNVLLVFLHEHKKIYMQNDLQFGRCEKPNKKNSFTY